MSGVDVAARGLAARALAGQRAFSDGGGAGSIGTSFGIDVQARLGETVSILEGVDAGTHNAVLAGTNDDDHTAGVQTLVDQLAQAGGGTIEVPRSCRLNFDRLEAKSHVSFRGATAQGANAPSWEGGLPIFQALPGAGWIIEAGPARVIGASFEGLKFSGNGLASPGGALHIPNWFRSSMRSCAIDFFAEQGIWCEMTQVVLVADVFVLNCLLDRNRAAISGAFQSENFTDSCLLRGEYTCSMMSGPASGPELRCAAVAITGGGNSWLTDVVGEFSDVAFHIEGKEHVVRGCRADFSRGHGFRIATRYSQFIGNKSHRNGAGADNVYADFSLEIVTAGSGINNLFEGNIGYSDTADANRVANVFQDSASWLATPNTYLGNRGFNQRGATYSVTGANKAKISTLGGHARLFANGDATPSVDNHNDWSWYLPTPVTVTAFDDGVEGQAITISSSSSGTVTIHHSATIVNLNAADRVLIAWKNYTYVRRGGVWYELAHGNGLAGGNAQVGDADKTLVVGAQTTHRWVAALTANRNADLSITGASCGDRFHIVRSGAGAFNLNVRNNGSTTIKSMPAGTWGVFEFDGAAWFPASFGTI